ncbi:hypothetical protein [Streptomyces sp. NPDC058603]|uniref:hypothetical protein n=1 Tax=Streptomyces sp. NPDC058603 TaxID=3346551 RepID=UPI003658A59E
MLPNDPFPRPRAVLTLDQKTSVEFAVRDLSDARATDLATLPAPALIILVERLRSRLDDVLTVLTDVAE